MLSSMAPREYTTLEVAGRELRLSSPGRIYFPAHDGRGPITKLDLARRDEEEGLGDAPWPPNFAKQPGEPKRVQPSKARKEPS
jgi:hypothetical protein